MAPAGYDAGTALLVPPAGVPLTSVHVDSHALGGTAARLLVEEVEDPGHRHRRQLYAPHLVERASS